MSRPYRSPQPVVWINGWPAMGKQTVAQCLAQILGRDRAVLIDDRAFTDQLHLPQDAQLGRCVELNQNHRKRAQSVGTGSLNKLPEVPGTTGNGNGNTNGSNGDASTSPKGRGHGPGGAYTTEDLEKLQLEKELRQKQEACFLKYLRDPAGPCNTDEQASLNRIIIFTDCRADDAEGAEGARRYATAAAKANRPFVPIYVECRPEEHERRSLTSDRQYYNFHLMADGGTSIVGNVTDAIREMQARGDGRLYTFPQDEYPGLFVNVTEQGTHETTMEILSFINAVCEKRIEAVTAMAAAAVQRRHRSDL
ncbi:hypothetical protein F503_07362 [Ophiostoma piceae UAMH 11346]|uniref:Uncharacterized protein n=1 Tax=Ophiostoma piceae (strain UAMH 11346) TaxID=1262450 RepID=S3CC87_OPHP1|nr:hypothetical protein F503_07362 [Ophiostoma piceae UAMH 11346]